MNDADIDDVHYWLTIERDERGLDVAVVTWQPKYMMLAFLNERDVVDLHLSTLLQRGMQRASHRRALPPPVAGWRMTLSEAGFTILDSESKEILRGDERDGARVWNLWREVATERGLAWMYAGSWMGVPESPRPTRTVAMALGMLVTGSVEIAGR